MEAGEHREGVVYLESSLHGRIGGPKRLAEVSDSPSVWVGRYLELAVVGVRSETVAENLDTYPHVLPGMDGGAASAMDEALG